MLLAVMGSGSHLKRPWDDRDFEQQHIGVSTSATDSSWGFSVDATSPIQRKLPPILTDNERPSQVTQGHSWSISAEPREALSGDGSPPPHTEGTLKRRRLSYEHKESTSTEGFDFKASTGNSPVSVLELRFVQTNKQCTPVACLHRLTEYASGLRQ